MTPSPPSSSSSPSPQLQATTQNQSQIPSNDPPSTDSPQNHQSLSLPLPLPLSFPSSTNPPKKPQPLPWTHEETTNLIRAYQEKWYSLKRGQLKASQWEEVAVTVAARCGFDIPSKSGTQCRHKIEKLRKRYRGEKQKPSPHSWLYFDLMDQLERGPMPISVAPPISMVKTRELQGDDEDSDDHEVDYGSHKGSEGGHGFDVSRSLRDRKMDEFEELIDGFFKGSGGKMNELGERGRKMGNFGQDSRFRKRKGLGFEEEEEQDKSREQENGEEEKVERSGLLVQLAGQMREFAERFVKMERKKMEMMRETERFRMEMENKRMEMILVSQQKTVELISRAFESHKKLKVTQDV
ncbi:hypothetical protein Ancab_022065 [Ancistrocladus abbreviatus]